jgi:DNA helicase II / ATP-dependent DNA helicase PcrA
LSLTEELQHVRRFYAPLLEQKYDDAAARIRDLEQLEQLAGRFDSRSQMLAELTLDPPASTQDFAGDPLLDDDWLTLSTIHSAKGLEWDSVFVLHAADGNIPACLATKKDADIEEERRLFYVSLTRAKTWLTICHPQRYYFSPRPNTDQHSFSQRTRFLPESILPLFDTIPARSADARGNTGKLPTVLSTAAVRQKIGKLW